MSCAKMGEFCGEEQKLSLRHDANTTQHNTSQIQRENKHKHLFKLSLGSRSAFFSTKPQLHLHLNIMNPIT